MNKKLSPNDAVPAIRILRYSLILLLILACGVFLQGTVLAAPENQGNISNSSATDTFSGHTETSEYSHLIELSFEENNYIIAGEAIVYSVDANATEELVLWIPENADIIQFQATDMMATVASTPVNYSREGNLLSFNPPAFEDTGNMPLLYGLRYSVHSHEDIPTYHKVLREEDVFGYPISRLILIVNHEANKVPSVLSAEGTPIIADEVSSDTNLTSYVWYSPQFREVSVILQKGDVVQTSDESLNPLIIPGIILIIIAAAVIYYRREKTGDFSELQDIYDAEMTIIAQIKDDRKKNKISTEEFESILKKHTDNAARVKRKIEKLKKT